MKINEKFWDMKNLLLVLIIFALVSCVGTKSATSYHYKPNTKRDRNMGDVTYVVEKSGYSIITICNPDPKAFRPDTVIYVKGRVDEVKKPYQQSSYIMKRGNDSHFVYNNKRYLIDPNPKR